MVLDLSNDEKLAFRPSPDRTIEDDRYPFSPRIRTLRGILAKLDVPPVREALPLPKVYAPPRAGLAGKRRGGR